jgi:pimeloyl-ACP methyl ester carboxylesterase
MHPWALDSSWMRFQVDDPRLASAYNIIGFDMRGAGHTKHRLSGYSDSWVLAADIAFLHHVSLCSLPLGARLSLTVVHSASVCRPYTCSQPKQ